MDQLLQEPNPEAAAAVPAAASAPVGFAKRKSRGANIRKREADSAAVDKQGGEDDTVVVRKAKQLKGDPLAFTTKTDSKQEATLKFESNKALQQQNVNDATRSIQTETEFDRDGRAQREKIPTQGTAGQQQQDDGTYKGMNSYIDYKAGFRREHTIGGEKGRGAHGPLRANVYARAISRFDYQPDLCKDYKETGFCSYGDACKFMHDRGDYKSGWELEREWEAEQKRKMEAITKGWNPNGEEGDEQKVRGGPPSMWLPAPAVSIAAEHASSCCQTTFTASLLCFTQFAAHTQAPATSEEPIRSCKSLKCDTLCCTLCFLLPAIVSLVCARWLWLSDIC